MTSKFHPGQILATPGAVAALQESGQQAADLIARHLAGDWGEELSHDDKTLNDLALEDGSRILSAYRTSNGEKIWVITEAASDDGRRAATTLCLPREY